MQPQFKRNWALLPAGMILALLAAAVAETGNAEPLQFSTRNPFALPKGVYYKVEKKSTQTVKEKIKKVITTEESKKQVVQLPRMSLQAVILGGPRRVAVINNRNYVVGEFLFGHELVEIGRDQVTLMGQAGSVVLFLETFPLKVSSP